MPPASRRPLPRSPDRPEPPREASSSTRVEDYSLFSGASGPLQINNGHFNAVRGNQYGRNRYGGPVQIIINHGPREMRPPTRGFRGAPTSSATSSIASVASLTELDTNRRPISEEDVEADVIAKLVKQMSSMKDKEKHLDAREAELESRERDIREREGMVLAREEDVERKINQLAMHGLELNERKENLERIEHRLSSMKESLLAREGVVKAAIIDLRDREAQIVRLSKSLPREQPPGPCDAIAVSVRVGATPESPMAERTRQLPSIPPPNRRQRTPSSNSQSSTPVQAIAQGPGFVVTTRTRPLPSRPDTPTPYSAQRPLPIVPNDTIHLANQCFAAEEEGAGNESGGVSGLSPSDSSGLSLDSDDEPIDSSNDEQIVLADRPPTYYESPEPWTVPNNLPGLSKFELAEQLRSALYSLGLLKQTPSPRLSPEPTLPDSTAFFGSLLKAHVEDISSMTSRADRAEAISWAIGMLVETGRIDEGTIRTLCDRVSEDEQSANVAVRALRRELERRHFTLVQLYAVRLLRIMLSYTTTTFHNQCSSPYFMEILEDIVLSDDANPAVRERTQEVIAAVIIPYSARGIDEAKVVDSPGGPVAYGVAY